jgi:long-chain acyl-CoA synthetase
MVGGDHLMAGYWSKPEATTRSFVKGWLRTGDIAWSDEGGHVYLVDRRAEMIITGGANVLPREIELVLESHRGVRECAVVGLPDKQWGELVTAFVVPEKGVALELERLNAHCVDRLPAFKRPRWIELVDALPKGVSGNVRRGDLRDGLAVGKSRKD